MPYEITRVVVEAANEQSPWVAGSIGVIGAVAGSLTTIIWTEVYNRRQARERSNALAFNVMIKIEEMYSLLTAIRKGVDEARTELAKDVEDDRRAPPVFRNGVRVIQKFFLHTYLQPSVGALPEREITGDELWAINRVGGSRLLTAVAPLARRYNTLMHAMRQYAELRGKPDESMAVVGADGIVATMEIDPSNHRQMLTLNSIEQLANEIARMADESTKETFEALKELAHAHRRPFGQKASFKVKSPEGVELEFKSSEAARYRLHWWQLWRKKYDHDDRSLEGWRAS